MEMLERTTRSECEAAFKFCYKYYNPCLTRWGNLPGSYDGEDGQTTYFSLSDLIDQMGVCSAIDVISYRSINDAYACEILIKIILKSAKIRLSYDREFYSDIKIYEYISKNYSDLFLMKKMFNSLNSIDKYVHTPHVFKTYNQFMSLLSLIIEDKDVYKNPENYSEIVRSIMGNFSDKDMEILVAYVKIYLEKGTVYEFDDHREEYYEGFTTGHIKNEQFKKLGELLL